MTKDVILSPRAVKNYERIIEYLTNKWGIPTANNFIGRFEEVISLLSADAGIYPFINVAKQVQKCVLTKHNVLYFKETQDSIKILTIFDTRQDPEKLTEII
jgi:plasmid stabilization system protein ParE